MSPAISHLLILWVRVKRKRDGVLPTENSRQKETKNHAKSLHMIDFVHATHLCADDTRLLWQNERDTYTIRVGIRVRSSASPFQKSRLPVPVHQRQANQRRLGRMGSTVDRDQGGALALPPAWKREVSLDIYLCLERGRYLILRIRTRRTRQGVHVRRKRRHDEEQNPVTMRNCTRKIIISMRFNNIGKVLITDSYEIIIVSYFFPLLFSLSLSLFLYIRANNEV